MAEEHVGPRPAAWTKIFTGFKVALDLKKLSLAAAGIFCTWIGWWVLSWLAFNCATRPDLKDYFARAKSPADKDALWAEFKARSASWNLLHFLAGDRPLPSEPGDIAASWQEYDALNDLYSKRNRYLDENIKIVVKDKDLKLEVGKGSAKTYAFTFVDEKDAEKLPAGKEIPLRDLKSVGGEVFLLAGVPIKVTPNDKELAEERANAADIPALETYVRGLEDNKRPPYEAALKVVRGPPPPDKHAGILRTAPWFENRGENPYLLVSRLVKASSGGQASGPTATAHFLASLADLVPVLLEPLVKILTPIAYVFHPHADWYIKIYLLLALLYALFVWGFFGGAITRIAAVQIARNEKISMGEAVRFAKDRCISFFAAPAFPLLLLAVLVVCLCLFGLVDLIPLFGDIFVAGLLWPVVLVVGLIMAVVLVGLVGWPLMNPTISVEGSDSFDALSRSYSYVYQAPWQYIWYGFLALVYGIAVVFFVGFMGSLIVFLGKWGVSQTPFIAMADREPSYLFIWAPTSFGWRDLLISDNAQLDSFRPWNYVGAALVSVWIYVFFLFVVGFGYSYFWTASTIIYFLMRRHVDDTEMDEVHLEEDEAADPFARPPTMPAPPASKSDKVSLAMVDAPVLRPSAAPVAPPAPPVPPPEPAASAPPPDPPPPVNP